MAFRDNADTVLVVLERHDNAKDPYAVLEELFSLSSRAEGPQRGKKPDCCTDSASPPVDKDLVRTIDLLIQARR